MKNDYNYFSNRDCRYFPCHEGGQPDDFNCLFCFCPLYCKGTECGGDFVILENGAKNCSGCLFPHKKENYQIIMDKLVK